MYFATFYCYFYDQCYQFCKKLLILCMLSSTHKNFFYCVIILTWLNSCLCHQAVCGDLHCLIDYPSYLFLHCLVVIVHDWLHQGTHWFQILPIQYLLTAHQIPTKIIYLHEYTIIQVAGLPKISSHMKTVSDNRCKPDFWRPANSKSVGNMLMSVLCHHTECPISQFPFIH